MSDDLTRWLDARAALKAQQAEIADRITAVDDQIRALLGDHTEAAAGRWRVTYRWVDSTRVDTRKVKELLPPELLSAVQTTSSARVLRVTEAPQ